jgi:hypothetical protein
LWFDKECGMATRRSLEWDTTFKRLATLLSAAAAIISIFSFLIGRRAAQHSAELAMAGMSPVEVDRIEVSPAGDTAYSLGDTLRFVTVAADAHGQALHAAAVHWTSDDPSVVEVDSTGQVVARGPGTTSVTVAMGGRAGRARIWVLPRATTLGIDGDSVIRVAEGATIPLRAAASDARGNRIPASGPTWTAGDPEVATIDSTGVLHGVTPGVTTVTVVSSSLTAERRVEVVPVAASITLTAGAEQRASVGERLGGPVAVQVVSRSGRPVANAVVRFEPSAAAGRVEPDSAMSDSHGVAATRWTLGQVPGRQRLAVEVGGIDSALVVTAEADPTPKNTRITTQSDSIVAEAGTTLSEAVMVQVTDSSGVALADLPVTWTALNGGSFSLASTRTDSTGMARAHWRLGPRAGRQRATVQVGNARTLPPFTLSAKALAGPVAALKVVGGDAQRGTVGVVLAKGVLFRVTDSLGNPLGGVAIHLSARQGEIDSLVHTGADGRASVRWTMGEVVGPARLMARLDARADSAVVTAVAGPATASAIVFMAPTTGTPGKALPKPVQVVVKDRHGNSVPGATVRFVVAAGKVAPYQGVTDSTGTAATAWTLGPKSGKQTLTAVIKTPAVRASHTITASAARAPAKAPTAKPAAKSQAPVTTAAKPKPAPKTGAQSGSDTSRKPFGVP